MGVIKSLQAVSTTAHRKPPSLLTASTCMCSRIRLIAGCMNHGRYIGGNAIIEYPQNVGCININNTYNHDITRILRLELNNTYHPNSNDPQQNKWIFKLQTKVFNPNNMKQPVNYNNNPMEYIYYSPLQSIISRIRIKLDAEALNIDKTT